MYLSITTSALPLILTLLTTAARAAPQVAPACDRGTFSGGTWSPGVECGLIEAGGSNNNGNLYTCDDGTTVTHKQTQILMRGGSKDTTVLVSCNGGTDLLFHCKAGAYFKFRHNGQCRDWVGSVYNVKED
ncbi:hypothetical protein E2P81_ATG02503 [Venturia nashicola]|uniref:Uncharacterized protein n=1 Tax=Venturia nashicola TaxID=86259 RepID=A0A4Z1P5H5_9PEZI|nr:hypothetical protein E6O75_ATG02562 [Venturia nashicola]TLD36721.1 hypothetical protein E2P81_ATG02503 [Venturia nashicola]